MSVIICYNCGRIGHLTKKCRQGSKNEICGPRGHAKFGSSRNDVGYHEPGVPRRLNYADQVSNAEIGSSRTTLDTREPGSAAEAACSVQGRNSTRSGNGGQGPVCNPSNTQTRRQ